MHAALRDRDPVMFFHYSAINTVLIDVPDEDYVVPIGEAAIRQEGTDITIVGYGPAAIEINKAMPGWRGRHQRRDHRPALDQADADRGDQPVGRARPAGCWSWTTGTRRCGTASEIIARVAIAVPGAQGRALDLPRRAAAGRARDDPLDDAGRTEDRRGGAEDDGVISRRLIRESGEWRTNPAIPHSR